MQAEQSKRGEGLVELGHVAADRRLALDQVDVVAGVGQFEGGLQSGDAAADDQRRRIDLDLHRLQRPLVLHALGAGGDHRLGLLGAGRLVGVDPRDVLAEVRHVEAVGIQAGPFAGGAERLFVQVRRAGADDHAGQSVLLDVVLDHLLAQRRTHELVVFRDHHVLDVLAGPAGDLLDIDRSGDIAAAVANVNADLIGHSRFSCRVRKTHRKGSGIGEQGFDP